MDEDNNYSIIFSSQARRSLRSLPSNIRQRINAQIMALAEDPRPPGTRAMQGYSRGLLRLRVGDYRVIYRVDDDQIMVVIVKVGHRSKIYRRR
ncbi:MAG: type II toxin-antitoxin system RelE/ParE family toxin [Hormoscilla sp. GUM202]|nr:type II toxin-antitoxin system RelE/ParE family toxin [Hormoscilla sp. GUM202]